MPLVDAYFELAGALGDLAVYTSPFYYDYRHPTTQRQAVVKTAVEQVLLGLVPEPSRMALATTALVFRVFAQWPGRRRGKVGRGG